MIRTEKQKQENSCNAIYAVCGNTVRKTSCTVQEPVCCPMPVLRPVTLNDRRWIAPLLEKEDSMASMGCFGTLYLWGSVFGQQAGQLGSRMIAKYETADELSFAYPFGSGSLRSAVLCMKRIAERRGLPLVINGMTEAQKQRLEMEFPDTFVFEQNRDTADYIYETEKLASLRGKKLQNKRNHCNRFEKEHPDWRFEPLEPRHFSQCRELLSDWEERHQEQNDMQDAEQNVVEQCFAHFSELGLIGGALFCEDRMVAFTIGELNGGHSVDVRLEKADTSVNGAYQMINREFVRSIQQKYPEVQYINREEDMGMENLRKAKLSYHPSILLMKYSACWC
ncbi:MAG: DUF2156 domain-containing protein [Butyricicoccus sp.]